MGRFNEELKTWAALLAAWWNNRPEVTLGSKPLGPQEWAGGGSCQGPSILYFISTWGLHLCVRGVDRGLRKAMAIREFCGKPTCIFRMSERSSPKHVLLADGTEIHAGDRVGDLHLWNENIARTLGTTVGLGVGVRFRTAFLDSMQDLALHAATDQQMSDIRAFRAKACWLWRSRKANLEAIIRQCGFTIVSPDPAWIERVHDAFENLLIYSLVWSFNRKGLRRRRLTPLRLQLWISRQDLLRRHLPSETALDQASEAVYATIDGDRAQPISALDSDYHPDKLKELLPVKEYHR